MIRHKHRPPPKIRVVKKVGFLENCWSCGGEGETQALVSEYHCNKYRTGCKNKDCVAYAGTVICFDHKSKSIDIWNSRPEMEVLRAKIEDLEKLLGKPNE